MRAPVSISFKEFASSVESAVKAATERNPKFKFPFNNSVSLSYLIRGIPVPPEILKTVNVVEVQAFAADVAARITDAHADAFSEASANMRAGGMLAIDGHLIIGIPAPSELVLFGP